MTYLVDDVDAVVDPLTSKDRVEVVEPVLQVVFPVTEWDDDGNLKNRDSFSCLFVCIYCNIYYKAEFIHFSESWNTIKLHNLFNAKK